MIFNGRLYVSLTWQMVSLQDTLPVEIVFPQ